MNCKNSARRVAFESLSTLRQWKPEETLSHSFFELTLKPGLEHHFKNPTKPVRVWAEFYEDVADVHFELNDEEDSFQPWILSFCLTPCHSVTDQESNSISFEEGGSPLIDHMFYWPCDTWTQEEVLKALDAWAECFWTDWDPQFIWDKIPSILDTFKELFQKEETSQFQMYQILLPEDVDPKSLESSCKKHGILVLGILPRELLVHATSDQMEALSSFDPDLDINPIKI